MIGTILGGIKPTYLGAPSMAYQIGPVTLDRDWTVAWPTSLPARDVDLIEAVAAQEAEPPGQANPKQLQTKMWG